MDRRIDAAGRALTRIALLAGLLLGLAGCASPLTQVILIVDTDFPLAVPNPDVPVNPGELRFVSVSLYGPCNDEGALCPPIFEDSEQRYDIPGGTPLPFSIGLNLVPGESLGPYRAEVTATIGAGADQQIVEVDAVFRFAPEETRVLPLYVVQACEGVTCATGESCSNVGTCVSERRNALPPWTEVIEDYSLEAISAEP